MQNVPMLKKELFPGQCIGVLAGTFGTVKGPLDEMLSTGKVSCFRIHLGGFCNHGSRCTKGECATNNLNCLRSRARTAEWLAQKYPSSKCFISPYAEYSEKNKDRVMSWFRTIHDAAPSCDLVASSFGGYIPPGVIIEEHGNKPKQAPITSNDGKNYFDSNSVKYNSIATLLSFAWTNRYNLRLTSEKGTVPPPQKRPKANRINKNDFIQMQLMQEPLVPMPPPPLVCKTIKRLTDLELWKNHSEDYGAANDSRGNKPLLIYKKRRSILDVYSPAGKKISCLKYYNPYSVKGYYRHYMGSCSGDDALTLYNKAGGEWAFIKDGDSCIAVTTIRRLGYYRE